MHKNDDLKFHELQYEKTQSKKRWPKKCFLMPLCVQRRKKKHNYWWYNQFDKIDYVPAYTKCLCSHSSVYSSWSHIDANWGAKKTFDVPKIMVELPSASHQHSSHFIFSHCMRADWWIIICLHVYTHSTYYIHFAFVCNFGGTSSPLGKIYKPVSVKIMKF